MCDECKKWLTIPGSRVICWAAVGGGRSCDRTRNEDGRAAEASSHAERIASALESIAADLKAIRSTCAVFPLSGPPRRQPAPAAPICNAQHPTDPRAVCVLDLRHELPHMKADGLKWGFPAAPAPEKCSSTRNQNVTAAGEGVGDGLGCTLDADHIGPHRDLRWPGSSW